MLRPVQFAVGSALALTMWTLNLHERPKVDGELIRSILPLAAVHTLGNLLTNVSLGQVAVSFTHTIKVPPPGLLQLSAWCLPFNATLLAQ